MEKKIVILVIAVLLLLVFVFWPKKKSFMNSTNVTGDIRIIKESNLNDLKDPDYVSNLINKLGFNSTENPHEQPNIMKENSGGLRIWQYPNQFSKYLTFLSNYDIKSYIEIGCRWGGTFILTTEYLKKFNEIRESTAIDIIDPSQNLNNYCNDNNFTNYLKLNSQSQEFSNFIKNKKFDLCLIDGDHSYEGVKNDYNMCKGHCKIFAFHDIVSDACPGVVKFWNELKTTEKGEFYEFTDQYEEVKGTFLGLGVYVSS